MPKVNEINDNTSSSVDLVACSPEQTLKKALQLVQQELKSVLEMKDLAQTLSRISESAFNIENLTQSSVLETAKQIVVSTIGELANEGIDFVNQQRRQVEYLINIIYNGKESFYLALSSLLVLRMMESLFSFRKNMKSIENIGMSALSIIESISKLSYKFGPGSVKDIDRARKYVEEGITRTVFAEQNLKKYGYLINADIESIKSAIRSAIIQLDGARRDIGEIRISKDNGEFDITFLLSGETKRLALSLQSLYKELSDQTVKNYSVVVSTYSEIAFLKKLFTELQNTGRINQVGASEGLYESILKTSENEMQSLRKDMIDFLINGKYTRYDVQYNKMQFLANAIGIYSYINSVAGNGGGIEELIIQNQEYNELKKYLETQCMFFDAKIEKMIKSIQVNIVETIGALKRAMSFNAKDIVSARRTVYRLTARATKVRAEAITLNERLLTYKQFSDPMLKAALNILERLGMDRKNSEVALATKQFVANLSRSVSVVAQSRTTMNCLQKMGSAVTNLSPEDRQKNYKMQLIMDEFESKEFMIDQEEVEGTAYFAAKERQEQLRKREKELTEKQGAIKDMMQEENV